MSSFDGVIQALVMDPCCLVCFKQCAQEDEEGGNLVVICGRFANYAMHGTHLVDEGLRMDDVLHEFQRREGALDDTGNVAK